MTLCKYELLDGPLHDLNYHHHNPLSENFVDCHLLISYCENRSCVFLQYTQIWQCLHEDVLVNVTQQSIKISKENQEVDEKNMIIFYLVESKNIKKEKYLNQILRMDVQTWKCKWGCWRSRLLYTIDFDMSLFRNPYKFCSWYFFLRPNSK